MIDSLPYFPIFFLSVSFIVSKKFLSAAKVVAIGLIADPRGKKEGRWRGSCDIWFLHFVNLFL